MSRTTILILFTAIVACSNTSGTSTKTPDAAIPQDRDAREEQAVDTSPTKTDTQTNTTTSTETATKTDAGTTADSLPPQLTPDSSVPDTLVQVAQPDAQPMAQDTPPLTGICTTSYGGNTYLIPAWEGTVCRKAAGPCDEPEYCDGIHPDCPADQLYFSGHPCGATPDCFTDVCSGTSPSCPPAIPQPAGTQCVSGYTPGQMGHCSGGSNATCMADPIPCGGPGQACCINGCATNDPSCNTACTTSGYGCTTVGGGNVIGSTYPCSAGMCTTPASDGTCVPCGNIGQPVCLTRAAVAYECTAGMPSCSPPAFGQPGYVCTCVACGASGQPVCNPSPSGSGVETCSGRTGGPIGNTVCTDGRQCSVTGAAGTCTTNSDSCVTCLCMCP